MNIREIVYQDLEATDGFGILIRQNLVAGKYDKRLESMEKVDRDRLKQKAELDLMLLTINNDEEDSGGSGSRGRSFNMK